MSKNLKNWQQYLKLKNKTIYLPNDLIHLNEIFKKKCKSSTIKRCEESELHHLSKKYFFGKTIGGFRITDLVEISDLRQTAKLNEAAFIRVFKPKLYNSKFNPEG